MMQRGSTFDAAAYGGDGWSPRNASLADEVGNIWGQVCTCASLTVRVIPASPLVKPLACAADKRQCDLVLPAG